MKLETIKKSKKKNILIGGLIILSLVSVVTYTTTRAKYKSVQSLKLATGSVNFKGADMSLVAINVSEDGTNYTSVDNPPEGNYRLNTTMSKCRIPTSTLTGENAPEALNVSIEYTNNKINILGLTTKNTKCYVYLDKVLGQTSDDIIAVIKGTNIYKGNSALPDFTKIAEGDGTSSTDNSGIYRVTDPMYKTTDNQNPMSYYFRGAVKNNYVKFGGQCWRIVRINGDRTIRLIYDGATCHANGTSTSDSIAKTSIQYNTSSDNSSYVGWTYSSGNQRPSTNVPQTSGTASNIKTVTENWFNSDAGFTPAQKAQVAEGKFCNDRSTQNNEQWRGTGSLQYYAAYQRLSSGTKTPTLACGNGDIYHSQVGLITADEVQFAGASWITNNISYYLYNGQYYWTMSPNHWNSGGYAYVFCVETNGFLGNYGVYDPYRGLRPVINLKADTVFNVGSNGTIDNPYVVQE